MHSSRSVFLFFLLFLVVFALWFGCSGGDKEAKIYNDSDDDDTVLDDDDFGDDDDDDDDDDDNDDNDDDDDDTTTASCPSGMSTYPAALQTWSISGSAGTTITTSRPCG